MFFVWLALLNFICFLPIYFLNFKEQKNPFEFILAPHRNVLARVKRLYSKHPYTDPFRINYDYTVIMLVAAAFNLHADLVAAVATLLWMFGFVEITYAAVMRLIFKRPASLHGDLSLAKSGLAIIQHRRWQYFFLAASTITVIGFGVFVANRRLLNAAPGSTIILLCVAAALSLPALYRWRSMGYPWFLYRTVYSPSLALARNLAYSRVFLSIRNHDPGFFEALNDFKGVELQTRPNIITVCVESYGSYPFTNDDMRARISTVLAAYESKLQQANCDIVSNFSEPPLFAGGSWLSYASFTYGLMDLNCRTCKCTMRFSTPTRHLRPTSPCFTF